MKIVAVLVEPQRPINMGLIARLCENFKIDELRIVNPRFSTEDWKIAEIFASRAKDRVRYAKKYIALEEALRDASYSIATSSIYRTEGGNIGRRAVSLEEIKKIISETDQKTIAVVFGRESSGLRRDEIDKCDVLLSIDASERYRTLNLACAAAIIFHSIYSSKKRRKTRIPAEREIINKIIDYFGEMAEEVTKNSKKAIKAKKAFLNILNRAVPDHREATLIVGVLRSSLKRMCKSKETTKS